jgi:hypothetical protein
MKSTFAVLSVLVATVIAQSNPLIPSGISDGCSAFLIELNADTTLSQCLDPINAATSQFGPTGDMTTAPSQSTVTDALGQLCSAAPSGSCSDANIRNQLAKFYTSCTEELTGANRNTDVLRNYDVLYTITPFKQAVCAKDDSGNFCVTQINPSGGPGTARLAAPNLEQVQQSLWTKIGGDDAPAPPPSKRAEVVQNVDAAYIPNTSTFREDNIAFLFLAPGLQADKLCVSCTRNVLTSYIAFEQSVPYAPGLASSPILGGQPDLYQAITNTCGANFMSGAVQAAGGLSGGLLSGAERTAAGDLGSVGTLMAAVAVGFAAVL